MNKLYCNDGCQKEFKITELKTDHVEILPGNVERYYLECPHCKQQYTSYYLNDEMKQIQLQIRALAGKEPIKIKQKNRLAKLERRIKFMGNQLKMKVEHGDNK